jgi:hypothetical protein
MIIAESSLVLLHHLLFLLCIRYDQLEEEDLSVLSCDYTSEAASVSRFTLLLVENFQVDFDLRFDLINPLLERFYIYVYCLS